MMLYENTKAVVHSLDGISKFFIIVTGVLQGDMLVPYKFMICLDYVLQMSIDLMKENSVTLKKARHRWYPAGTMTDANSINDLELLTNTRT